MKKHITEHSNYNFHIENLINQLNDELGGGLEFYYERNKDKSYVKDIIKVVCDEFGITQSDLIMKNRKRIYVDARRAVIFFAIENTSISDTKLSHYVGLDRSSVTNQKGIAQDLYAVDTVFRNHIENCKLKLK